MKWFFLLCLFVTSMASAATPITLYGDNITVTYDSSSTSLLGPPIVVGDSILFFPTTFSAVAIPPNTFVDIKHATITMMVQANRGTLTSASLIASGDYMAQGGTVSESGQLRIRPLVPLATTLIESIVSTPTPAVGPVLNDWESTAFVNFLATSVQLTVEDVLFASAFSNGSFAFIEKKELVVNFTTVPPAQVPEPASAMLMLFALFCFGINRAHRA